MSTVSTSPVPAADLRAHMLKTYHVFIASPSDVQMERQHVRDFFEQYNRNYAGPRNLEFKVVDWENYASAGVGRPQELITEQTLERFKDSLAMVIGIMAQRFGSASGTHESGTEEEFEWALRSRKERQWPVVKWFFKDIKELRLRPEKLEEDSEQWKKVEAFRNRVEAEKQVFYRTFADLDAFDSLLEDDVAKWLSSPERPWFTNDMTLPPAQDGAGDWPAYVLSSLSLRLNEDFVEHMKTRDDLTEAQARKRYIQTVLKQRRVSTDVPLEPGAGETSAQEQTKDSFVPGGTRHGSSVQPYQGAGRGESSDRLPDEGALDDYTQREGVRLLVVGPGGLGKTTTLRHLAAEGARRAVNDATAPVHVYLRLTAFDAKDDGFEALLDRLSEAAGLDRESFEQNWLLGSRAIVFLLDAFNEVGRTHRDACTKALITLLQGSRPTHRFVITTRPGSELERIAGQTTENLGLKVLDLLEFGPEKVDAYLKAQGLEKLAPKFSTALKALAPNPFLLWAITRVFAGSPRGSTPTNRGTLFKALIDDYIFEQREKSKPKPRPTRYNYQLIKKPVLARVALDLIKEGATQIRLNDSLRDKVADILKQLGSSNKQKRTYPFEEEIFMSENYDATTLLDEMQDNGILVREADELRFMHETVQEYFGAVALQNVSQKDFIELVPPINVAVPHGRGPIFETLVTLAGLTDAETLVQLASHVEERHPLLAGHMYVEAGLLDRMAILARDTFLPMLRRAHEGYQRLGVMGLALSDLGDPSIADQLLRVVRDHWSPARNIAEEAIVAQPTDYIIESLINISLAAPKGGYEASSLLARMIDANTLRILEALVRASGEDSKKTKGMRDLFSRIIDRIYSAEGKQSLKESLIAFAAEREADGISEHVELIDSILLHADFRRKEGLPIPKFEISASDLDKAIAAGMRERSKFAVICSSVSNNELEQIIKAEQSWKAEIAYDEMKKRLFPPDLRIRVAVTKAMQTQKDPWLTHLSEFSREQILTSLSGVDLLDGEEREHIALILGLFGDRPSQALEQLFQNAGEELRAFAARAAARTDAGVQCLIRQLCREGNGKVIEASLRALGRSNAPDAVAFLQDMLLNPQAHSHWPSEYDGDDWDKVLQEALVDAGAVESTLARLADAMTSLAMGPHIVHAAGRWIDGTAAANLLRRIMEFEGSPNRNIALWYLARNQNAKEWSQLLLAEVDIPAGSKSLAEDAARCFAADNLDTEKDLALAAAARDVLRPSLAGPDPGKRIRALNLATHMPEHWIDAAWQAEALTLAKRMAGSDDSEERQAAVRPLLRFAANAEEPIRDLMLNDPVESVREEAAQAFGTEGAKKVIAGRLGDAIQHGDPDLARRATLALTSGAFKYSTFHTSDYPFIISLQSGTVQQAVAALFALSQVYSDYGSERQSDEWAAIRTATAAAFRRHGVESLWQAYVDGLGEMSKDPEVSFFTFRIVLQSLWGSAANLRLLVADAASIWPNDLNWVGVKVDLDIETGDEATALETLERLRTDSKEQLHLVWLAQRYRQLKQYDDAVHHLREAISENTNDPNSWFQLGWCLFLTKEFAASAEASRKALELRPAVPTIAFNLGLALLAGGQIQEAERTYRVGCAIARRQSTEDAITNFKGAIGDFPLLPELTGLSAETRDRMEAMLEAELARLQAHMTEGAGNAS